MESLRDSFKEKFNINPYKIYFSPGRVNLIGEHIDYNGGHVLPFSVSLGIYGAVAFNSSKTVNTFSEGFNNCVISFPSENFEKTDDYSVYIKGILYILKKEYDVDIPYGFNLYMKSTLPVSSGLSSSAALELLILNILNDEFSLGFNRTELALIAQKAENTYVNVNCGIMDQFIVSNGKKNNAVLLDTNTLNYSYIPFDIDDNIIVVVNTNKPRNLIKSKYNERRNECEQALNILKCDKLVNADLKSISVLGETLKKRARHVITEEKRVKDACEALRTKNFERLGNLLKESHNSLKSDYEVTGLELDTISDELNRSNFVYGARMTGAGFGGCVVSLFRSTDKETLASYMKEVNKKYNKETGLNLTYYVLSPEDGVKEIF